MKNLNSEAFEKNIKRNHNLLIVGIILLLLTIALVYFGIQNEKKPLPTPVSLREYINNGGNSEDVYSYIDVSIKPYLFAVYEKNGIEESNKYYLTMDKENYLYVIYMNNNKFEELNVDSINENPIRTLGITKKIPSDIKKLVIESYNDLMEEEYLTFDNFKEYVGLVYLDTLSPVNDSSFYYLGAILSGIFTFLLITIYTTIIVKNKKTLKSISHEELEKIAAEIYQDKNIPYEKMKFYLLKDNLVDLESNIVILKYSDILWAYPFEQRYNGLLINKCIKIVDINNKMYSVANTKLLDKNKDNILEEILSKLKEKNPEIVLGFTKEKKNQVKEKVKSFKKK